MVTFLSAQALTPLTLTAAAAFYPSVVLDTGLSAPARLAPPPPAALRSSGASRPSSPGS